MPSHSSQHRHKCSVCSGQLELTQQGRTSNMYARAGLLQLSYHKLL
jgi:hypothetical protein